MGEGGLKPAISGFMHGVVETGRGVTCRLSGALDTPPAVSFFYSSFLLPSSLSPLPPPFLTSFLMCFDTSLAKKGWPQTFRPLLSPTPGCHTAMPTSSGCSQQHKEAISFCKKAMTHEQDYLPSSKFYPEVNLCSPILTPRNWNTVFDLVVN